MHVPCTFGGGALPRTGAAVWARRERRRRTQHEREIHDDAEQGVGHIHIEANVGRDSTALVVVAPSATFSEYRVLPMAASDSRGERRLRCDGINIAKKSFGSSAAHVTSKSNCSTGAKHVVDVVIEPPSSPTTTVCRSR